MPPPQADTTVSQSSDTADRRYRRLAVGILVVAAVWRAAIAATIPCIARDSVMFCWYARDLGEHGLAHLREPTTHQHPLFPTLVLAVQRSARLLGAPEAPLTWQAAGQVVSGLAGMAVVALAGAMTLRFVRRLRLPVDEKMAGCCGLLLAALLPLNVWFSAEVMSDQLHLAFYLAGALVLLKLDSSRAAGVCGLAGGLAFLTRPEGIVVVFAGLITLAADRLPGRRVRIVRGVVLVCAFLLCALPFWLAVGTLSPKKNPLDWLRGSAAAFRAPAATPFAQAEETEIELLPGTPGLSAPQRLPRSVSYRCTAASQVGLAGPVARRSSVLARLELLDLPWYALLPWALYTLFRAGRVVVPLLAIFPMINLRRCLLRPPLIGLSTCLAGHFALTLILLHRHQYLSPRHMLVVVMLLVPFAATLLARMVALAQQRGSRGLPAVVVGVFVLPLALLALRQPNHADRHLVQAARWLTRRDADIASKVVMCASSERRIVFYANARWLYWYDVRGDAAGPRAQILKRRPDYFVIETGPGFERSGNDQVLEELRADEQLALHLAGVEAYPHSKGGGLHFFAFDWPAE